MGLFFSFLDMNGYPQASGASPKTMVSGPLPPPLQEGRNWDRLFDVLMESSTHQDLVLQQVGGRLGLLEDIQRQTEAGETLKNFFMSYQVVSCLIYLYLVIMSSTP